MGYGQVTTSLELVMVWAKTCTGAAVNVRARDVSDLCHRCIVYPRCNAQLSVSMHNVCHRRIIEQAYDEAYLMYI